MIAFEFCILHFEENPIQGKPHADAFVTFETEKAASRTVRKPPTPTSESKRPKLRLCERPAFLIDLVMGKFDALSAPSPSPPPPSPTTTNSPLPNHEHPLHDSTTSLGPYLSHPSDPLSITPTSTNPAWTSPFPPLTPSVRDALLTMKRDHHNFSVLSPPLKADWQTYFGTECLVRGFCGKRARSCTLLIYALPGEVDEGALGRYLGRWGTVTGVWKFRNRDSDADSETRGGGGSFGSGSANVYVEFASREDVRAVLERGRECMIGFRTGYGRPSFFWDYAEDNGMRIRYGWGEGAREKESR